MAVKVIGKVRDASDNTETTSNSDLHNVQNKETPIIREMWEIPDSQRKGGNFSAERTNSYKKENTFKKEEDDFSAARSNTFKYENPLQKEQKGSTQKGKVFPALNNVQEPTPDDYSPKANQADYNETERENKEIAFFTEPKTVKRKTQRHIFGFQAVTAAALCLIMLLLKFFAPELYDNLHLYYFRLFQW